MWVGATTLDKRCCSHKNEDAHRGLEKICIFLLQQKWGSLVIYDFEDKELVIGEKIAEGGQAEIFNTKYIIDDGENENEEYVVKVWPHFFILVNFSNFGINAQNFH